MMTRVVYAEFNGMTIVHMSPVTKGYNQIKLGSVLIWVERENHSRCPLAYNCTNSVKRSLLRKCQVGITVC